MKYITHKREDGQFQLLSDHLKGVAQRAAEYGAVFGCEEHARRIGLLHDIGKYSPAAQERQLSPESVAPVDHTTAGTIEAWNARDIHGAFAICGHHGGLPNRGSKASLPEDGNLFGRIKKRLDGRDDPSIWKKEITVPSSVHTPLWLRNVMPAHQGFANALYTRMLFSCLVDADYLDTELHMLYGNVRRGNPIMLSELLIRVERHIAPWLNGAASDINKRRNEILRECLKGAERKPGLYTLTIPTGGGKTMASLAFALSHAVQHGQQRVIYVVPYTSIIEQNARIFRDVLGDENVLEHHVNVDFDPKDESAVRIATENWDAPVIVTTAVQFFESLFSCRTSRCRKLHNIANSVVIFDEAQMLPLPYLIPCVNAIAELVQHYKVTAVLCTATQPALGGLLKRYDPGMDIQEIGCDVEGMYQYFQRVCFHRKRKVSREEVAENLGKTHQVLCIVNSRKAAQSVYSMLPEDGRFHLSTLMTPEHRTTVLEEIRKRLKEGKICRVVSTSLVEAGVDVDFPQVWREMAGLDSILQAAGRCNREGKRALSESKVYIFSFDEPVPRMFEQNISAAQTILDKYDDISSPEAIKAYFSRLLTLRGEQALDVKEIIKESAQMNFRTINDAFKMIEDQTIPVYIPAEGNRHLLDALKSGEVNRSILRKLGRSAVNVYPDHFQKLKEAHVLDMPMGDQFGILIDKRQYDDACGLSLEPECSALWFC